MNDYVENDNDNSNDAVKIPNGIEICDDKCKCGGNLRLHTYNFRQKDGRLKPRHYIDCDKYCGRVTEWYNSIDEAIDAYDAKYENA